MEPAITPLAIFIPFLITGGLIGWWQGVCKRIYAKGPEGRGALGGGWLPAGTVVLAVLFLSFGPQEVLKQHIHPLIIAQFSILSILAVFAAGLGVKEDKAGTTLPMYKYALLGIFITIYAFVLGPTFLGIPFMLDRVLTLIIWAAIIRNIFHADTMDGLAIVHAVAILFGVTFFIKPINLIALPTIGAILAFLRFNRPKAIFYWGEAGRLWLGVIIGGIWLLGLTYTPENTQSASLIILLLPLIFSQLFTLKSWHKRAQDIGLSDGQILFRTAYIYSAIFICAFLSYATKAPLIFIPTATIILAGVALRIRYLENAK